MAASPPGAALAAPRWSSRDEDQRGASSRRAGPALGASSPTGRGPASDVPGAPLIPQERRDEVRQTAQLIRKFKALCRDYGVKLDVEEVGGLFSQQPKPKDGIPKGRLGNTRRATSADQLKASSDSSDSSSDNVWDRSDVELAPMPWEKLKAILDGTQVAKRVNALRGIDRAISASRVKAEEHLLELQTREDEAAAEAANPESATDERYDQLLLRWDARRDMPAAAAAKRCIALVPTLQKNAERVLSSQRDRAALAASTAAMASTAPLQTLPEFEEREAETSTVDDADESEEEESEEEEGATGEVNRKLQRFNALPADTDPAVALVLQAQREKIKTLAQDIDEGEHVVEVHRLALDYLDKRSDGKGVDPGLFDMAKSLAREIRCAKYEEQLERAKKEMEIRAAALHLTTEEEVEAAEAKCVTVAENAAHSTEAAKQKELGGSVLTAPGLRSRGSKFSNAPALLVPLRAAGKEKARLLLQQKKLKEDMDGIERRSDELKNNLRNGEQTAKALEEIKTLFLLQIAKEQPNLLRNEFDMDVGNQGDLTPSCVGSSDSEDDDSEEARARKGAAISALTANTERLNSELKAAEQALREITSESKAVPQGAVGRSMSHRPTIIASSVAQPKMIARSRTEVQLSTERVEDALAITLREAALLVQQDTEQASAKIRRTTVFQQEQAEQLATRFASGMSEEAEAEAEDMDPALQAELAAMNAAEEELADAATRRLRGMRCEDIRDLLRLRARNEELVHLIDGEATKLDHLRAERGSPGVSAHASSPGHRFEVEGGEPALVAEVMLKRRELLALRRRWWSERQDTKTAARRASAGVELGTAETEDPPMCLKVGGSVDRICAALTM